MEHHIYLTFLSALRSDLPFNRTEATRTIVQTNIFPPFNEIYQTSESALKELLYNRQLADDEFTLDKMFFFETNELKDEIIDEDNPNTTITTKAIFESQMKDFISAFHINLDWSNSAKYIHCDDIEEINSLKASILAMSRQIMMYYHDCLKNNDEDSTVVLHVDLTGGPRTAIMLMLAIIRLVAYQGIQIGSISYANLDNKTKTVNVYESKDIYLLFDMIAGFSEFNRYGSVHTLQEYFKKVPTKDMITNRLLDTMGDFSEAISLSSRGLFQSAIEQLDSVLTDIKKSKPKDNKFESEILKLMRNKIQDSYQTILEDKDNDLVYIDWCLKNDYLQQALALFVEYIPRTILKEKIISLDPQKFTAAKGDRRKVEMQNFNEVNQQIGKFLADLRDSHLKPFYDDIKDTLKKHIDGLHEEISDIRKLMKKSNTPITKETTNLANLEKNIVNHVDKIVISNHMTIKENTNGYQYTQFIDFLSNLVINSSNIIELNTFPFSIRYQLINLIISENPDIKTMLSIDEKNGRIALGTGTKYFAVRSALFTVLQNKANQQLLELIFGITINKEGLYQYDYENDFPHNMFEIDGLELNQSLTKSQANDVMDLLTSYSILKKTRNDSAHANEEKQGEYTTSHEIRTEMERCVNLIKTLSKHIKAH
ncbi:MAG: hypothetical protein D8B58_11310 [Veillonella sp.]|jgi:hypothetical protein|nr:MAG: hypothetical protein D8B58_11310 [Veillonella sp.]